MCGSDLDIYITQDGHGVSLRKVLEAEILNYEQGEPTKKAHVTPAGRKGRAEGGHHRDEAHCVRVGGESSRRPGGYSAGAAALEEGQVYRQDHLRRPPDLQDCKMKSLRNSPLILYGLANIELLPFWVSI